MSSGLQSAVCTGTVWHRRSGPRDHAFRYRLYFSLLDLDQLPALFSRSRLWSLDRPNLVNLKRTDFLEPHDRSIAEAVRDRVEQALGQRPDGQLLMLTHLRQWGLCFNPVTFYFCFHQQRLMSIIAEVHNTPWNERRAYVLDARGQTGPEFRFNFAKDFHVSPFLPMDLDYDWRFRIDSDRLHVHMLLIGERAQSFQAGMTLALAPLTGRVMTTMPLKYPFVTLRVVAGIYWQAFRLWLKRTPFHPHPDQNDRPAKP